MDEKNINYFRGPKDNVMKRFVDCIDQEYEGQPSWFVRVGGDDPFVSIEGIQAVINDLNVIDSFPKNMAMYYNSYEAKL